MTTDNRPPLSFPSPDDDAELAARLAALYDATPAPDDAQIARCTTAVLAAAMHAPTGARSRFGLRPRWWWGAAAAALLVAVTMRPWRPDHARREADSVFVGTPVVQEPRGTTTAESGGAGDVTRFDLALPSSATAVSLVGDFNGWDERATPMVRRSSDGTWSARVPLAPGRHVYAFVIDGQRWLVDPLAPQVPDAGFGPANAVVVDGAP